MTGRGRIERIIPDDFIGRYVSHDKRREIAEAYGVSESTIDRWARIKGLSPRRMDVSEVNRRKSYVGENNPAFGYRKVQFSRGALKKMKRLYFTKRLSERYGYVYDDMIEGGERVGKVMSSAV